MNNWEKWYESFLENKKNNEMKAFAAGLRGEKFEPIMEAKFDSTSSWSELLSILRDFEEFQDVSFDYKDGNISCENKLIKVCFDKARKIYGNYNTDENLNYLMFNYLKTFDISDVFKIIKIIREIPEDEFLECKNCGFLNENGWSSCDNCKINLENSYDLYFS